MSGKDPLAPKDASDATRAANEAAGRALPLHDRTDFERAARGRIAGPPAGPVRHAAGHAVWNLDDYAFLDAEAPPTVNPSLWRQAQLNRCAGLFEVAQGFYQVRGLDLSNVSFVAGESGWIVIDPLTSAETAAAALALANEHLGPRPVRAVLYTHSHIDHFAGVRGVVAEEDVRAGRVPVIAPEGFLEAAIRENVVAGNVMTRRASYMYGALLPRGPRGHVDSGLGKGVPLLGSAGLIAPTDEIRATGEERRIDGVRLRFQLTPDTEAPAEMNFFFPECRVLCMAENCCAVLHNLYTPRGAQVRDALAWSRYIHESILLFAADTDVVFASHHWPRFGREEVRGYLEKQRDLYRYLHDQTLRLANHGKTMLEIAEELTLPPELGDEFFNRGYYGTVNHNAKAVYQRYLGWFDGNPANLHPLPPEAAGPRYVEFMGGGAELLRRARECFERGEYRWVAQVLNHLVFAEPGNGEARALQADALEQLGYQAESAPWRDFYLTGAQELRRGVPKLGGGSGVSEDVARAMSTSLLIDYLGVRLDGPAAAGLRQSLVLRIPDRGEVHTVGLAHGALHHSPGVEDPDADAVLTADWTTLVALAFGRETLGALAERGAVTMSGNPAAAEALFARLDRFAFWFEITSP